MRRVIAVVAAVWIWSTVAEDVASQVHLHALHDGIAGPGDEFGVWASASGQIDGEGCADIAVGVRYYQCTAGDDAGAVFLFSGKTGEVIWGRCGVSGENFGSALDFIGDITGDGRDDLVVGAVAAAETTPGSGDPKGRFYVISGADGTVLHSETGGQQNDWLGYRVAGGGDLNDDGIPDYLVSALFAQKPAGGAVTGYARAYSGLDHSILFTVYGSAQGDDVGSSLDIIADLDGDDRDDAIIGISQGHATAAMTPGRVLLVSGATPPTATDPIVICTLNGDAHLDAFGSSVCAIGYVDEDDIPDIAVGAPQPVASREGAGYVRVFSGGDCGMLWELMGETPLDALGGSVANAGDFNGDGVGDVLIAAGGFDGGTEGSNTGKVTVYSVPSGLELFVVEGAAAQDSLSMCAGGGDFNCDGYDDVVIGTTGDDLQGLGAGTAYAYCGFPNGCQNTPLSIDTDSDGIPDDCEPWTDLRHSLAGVDGLVPKLDGFGFLVGGKPMRLDLTNAKPLMVAVLFFGVDDLYALFKGGTMVPDPIGSLTVQTTSTGSRTLGTTWPAGVPTSIPFYFQIWIVDSAGPVGFSASNGLVGTTP